MRKRKTSSLDEVGSSGSEMEVDGEEKMEMNEADDVNSSEDEQSEVEEPSSFVAKENPFLDSFYGLSSEDPRERSNAAKTMLHQCLLGPDANSKDASYALRRLLNGLCSGRAAARQGNASALTSFLKASFQLDKIEEIQNEMKGDDPTDGTPLSFIREKLLAATDPSQISGKRKGSEERDYQFGRLFGILGVIRSGILLPDGDDDSNMSNIIEVVRGFVEDLVELFWLKRWMREPATHGIATLLKSFYQGSPEKECTQIVDHLVNEIVIPKVLLREEGETSLNVVLESYSAEQIGLACFIQSHAGPRGDKLSFPLNESVLSVETVPLISNALAETSVVVQPRMHFVWDTLWCYLFEMKDNEGDKETQWTLQETCAISGGKAVEILEQIVQTVVVKKLLGMDSEKSGTSKATHERRSLALCIIKTLCGVVFASSICGPSNLLVDSESIERFILTPSIIRRLFVDTICAGKQNKSQSSHLLKPLALEVLTAMSSSYSTADAASAERRLTIAKAFLKAEVRFDARTKTSTVEDMLGLSVAEEEQNEHFFALVDHYLRFLKGQFLSACADANQSTAGATGFVEAMYSAVKRIIRVDGEKKTEVALWKKTSVRGVVNFFMVSAFFDCSEVKDSKGKKKKKKNKGDHNSILDCATSVKDVVIPHAIRSVISARFFSLIADCIHQETHQKSGADQEKVEKDAIALSFLSDTSQGWLDFENAGGKRYSNATVSDDDESKTPDVRLVLEGIGKMMSEISDKHNKDPENSLIEAKKRCCTGVATFAHTLYLHRLNCANYDDEMDDNPDADEEDDEEEICNALKGLNEILQDFLSDDIVEENPLLGLSELCANILSSPLGSGEIGRGASPKLIRESVKFAWLGGLKLSSSLTTQDRTFLDSDVVGTLMDAVGANVSEDDEMDGEDSDGDSSNGEDDDSDSEMEDEGAFSKASNLMDSESMEVDDKQEGVESDEDESDVELDQDKLQSVLEEDSDADVDPDVLEHHEGADAALAQLIKLKQDARKAGQQAREKMEVQNQLRCTLLLELLFGRPDAWNSLFRTEIVASMLLPLLQHRKKTEKSMEKTQNRQKSGYGEKRSLVEKLTSLLKTKICKLKASSMPMSSLLNTETASKLIESIADELRHTESKDQSTCCSNAMVFVLRSAENVQEVVSSSSTFENLVEEWSTKRSSRIGGSSFDELIIHLPQ